MMMIIQLVPNANPYRSQPERNTNSYPNELEPKVNSYPNQTSTAQLKPTKCNRMMNTTHPTQQRLIVSLSVVEHSKVKGKGKCSAYFCSTRKALRHGSHSFTCNYTNACFYLVSVHQMAPP